MKLGFRNILFFLVALLLALTTKAPATTSNLMQLGPGTPPWAQYGMSWRCANELVDNGENRKFYRRLLPTVADIPNMVRLAKECGLYIPETEECPDLRLLKNIFLNPHVLEETIIESSRKLRRDPNEYYAMMGKPQMNSFCQPFGYANRYLTIAEVRGFAQVNAAKLVKRLRHRGFRDKKILILGGGFGREARWPEKNTRGSRMVVVERDPVLLDVLRTSLLPSRRISVVGGDFLTMTADDLMAGSKRKYDIVMIMWSGIFEFSPLQKQHIYGLVSQVIPDDGIIVTEYRAPVEHVRRQVIGGEQLGHGVERYEFDGERLMEHTVGHVELSALVAQVGLVPLVPPVLYAPAFQAREMLILGKNRAPQAPLPPN